MNLEAQLEIDDEGAVSASIITSCDESPKHVSVKADSIEAIADAAREIMRLFVQFV